MGNRKVKPATEGDPAPQLPIQERPDAAGDISIDSAQSIEEVQRKEFETLTAIHESQIQASAANAVRNTSGSTSPVRQDRAAQNKCPKCGNEYLTVYAGLKICGPCGWRSDQKPVEEADQHEMKAAE